MILLTDVQTCTEKLASLNRRKVESRSSVGKAASQDLTDGQINKKKKTPMFIRVSEICEILADTMRDVSTGSR